MGGVANEARADGAETPAAVTTGSVLTAGAPIHDRIDFAFDNDWHRVQVRAGERVRVTLAADEALLADTDLAVRDVGGDRLNGFGPEDASGSRSLEIDAFIDRTLYIAVESVAGAGDYTLSLDPAPPGRLPGAPLAIGAPESGALAGAGAPDWRPVSLEGGLTYAFEVSLEDGASPLMTLLDPEGRTLFVSTNPRNPTTRGTFEAETDLEANLVIDALSSGAAETLDYTVTVEALTPVDGGADGSVGGAGDDSLVSGDGADVVDAGDGDDTVKSGGGNDRIDGGGGDDVILSGDGDDVVRGGDGNDNIKPGRGDDTVLGGAGDDVVAGFRGDERFEGEDGNDRLLGSVDDDTLIGGPGDDRLWGGPGFDVFVFETRDFGNDTLPLDVRVGSDVLDFTAIDGLSRDDFTITQVGSNVVLEVADGGSLVMNGVRFGGLFAAVIEERFDEFILLA